MSNSWDKVRSFLDTMEIQDLYSSIPSTYASSSSLLSYSSCVHPLPLGAESWLVGEKTIKQILGVIQPTVDSEKRRRDIIEYLQTLIEGSFGVKVFVFGSVPLKTYLPHGDIDLTVVSHCDSGQDLASDIHSLLLIEMANNTKFQVRDVIYVPAQVKVIKCSVSNTPVDISFNQTAGLSALCLLEQVDQFIGRDHLFKHSVILIKAWCYYESRLLGGYYGLLSTYALETLVLHLINNFHSSLHCPLAVLYKFLEYFSKFDWERYCVVVNGCVSISSLPEMTVQRADASDELLITEEYLRNFREAFLFSTRGTSGAKPTFPVKFLNIVDPLRNDNNLGRRVSKGNFYRFRSALAYGTEKLSEVLTLPPEKIFRGLEKFLINTLERNGKTNLADVPIQAPAYDTTQGFETEDTDDLLSGIEYDLWFNGHGTVSPAQLSSWAGPQGWSNEWAEMGQNMAIDQGIYYDMDESLLISSIGSPTCFQLNSAVYEEQMGLARGSGLYIPHLEHLIQRRIHLASSLGGLQREEVEEAKKEEGNEEAKSVDSTEFYTPKGDNSSDDGSSSSSSCLVVLDYSLEEFPPLPGSKPIPIPVRTKGTQPEPTNLEDEVNNGGAAFASQTPGPGLELESFKYPSPMSVPLSEPGKQSEFSVSAILEPLDEPSVGDKQEVSKTEKKPYELSPFCYCL